MANTYRYSKPGNPASYRYDSSGSNQIEMGDLVYFDVSAFVLKQMTAGNGPEFVGVASDTGPTPASQIDNAPSLIVNGPVESAGVFRFKTTAADSLVHGDIMVIGADAQTLLKRTGEALTEVIAYFWNPTGSAAVVAGGEEQLFLITAQLPAAGIL